MKSMKLFDSKIILALAFVFLLFPTSWLGFSFFGSNAVSSSVGFTQPINLSSSSFNASYPFVASTGSHVYVAWTEGGHGIWFRSSADNGNSWSGKTRLSPVSRFGNVTSYPITVANGSYVYVVWTQTLSKNGVIYVAVSSDYGATFNKTALTRALSPISSSVVSDIPYAAAYANNVYVIWHELITGQPESVGVRSSNTNGVAWGSPFMLDLTGPGSEPQIAAWGNYAYATWGRTGAFFSRTTDGGQSWSGAKHSSDKIQNLNPLGGAVRESWISASGSNVYVTWNDNSGYGGNTGTKYHPYIMASHDNGQSWITTYKINLFPDGTSDWEVQSTAQGKNVYVSFRDHTLPYSPQGSVFFMESTDGGSTWTPPIGSSIPLDLSSGLANITGWANGVAVSGNTVAVVYPSNCAVGQNEPFPNSGAGACTMYASYSNDGGQSFYVPADVSKDRTSGPIRDVTTSTLSASGSHVYVTWQDQTSSHFQVYFSVTNGQTMNITPVSGAVGTSVAVSGNHFRSSSSITILFDGKTASAASSNSSGGFSVSFSVPQAVAGSHIVTATDGSNSMSKNFNVVPKITPIPNVGIVGKTITVTGSGFAGGSSITVTYGGNSVATSTSNGTGGFAASFATPASVAGKHTIRATDGTNSASASYTVVPHIILSTTSHKAGSTVTVNGTGFAASSKITLTFNGTTITTIPQTVTTDGMGNFTATFTVPNDPAATYTVQAMDGSGNAAKASFTIS